MLVEKGKAISITTLFNDELVTLVDSEEWSIWLKEVRDLADNTITVFMKSMERFWIWSLYNSIGVKESFPSYQARYRESLRDGFEIYIEVPSIEFDEPIRLIVCSCKPMKKSTVNKELAGINSYFYFTEESKLIEDHRFINQLYEKKKSSKSFLASIEIKKSSLAQEASSAKLKYLPPYKISRNRQKIKYFPMELFDELLSIAKPREKLIYLLCGACSARIGQALNLTLYDIDYRQKELWLLDPKSDYEDIYGNKRRVWLKEEYEIKIENKSCEHNTADLQFKYPIPLYHEALYWINEDKYKSDFFTTLHDYTKTKEFLSENARYPRHPFLFTSKTGKRVHARDTLSRFKSALRKLSQRHREYEWINELGLHSLRHMFGHYHAEMYARTGDDSLVKLTMEMMGHSSVDSTLIYFNMSKETKRAILKRHVKEMYSIEYKPMRGG